MASFDFSVDSFPSPGMWEQPSSERGEQMLTIEHFMFQPDRHILYTGLIVGADLTATDA